MSALFMDIYCTSMFLKVICCMSEFLSLKISAVLVCLLGISAV